MPRKALLLVVMWIVASFAFAEKPASADKILAAARAQAKAEQKSILLVFGASWCPDCEVLDTFFNAPQAKPIFDKHFVLVHLNVFEENGENPGRNTPGGDKVILKYGGVSSAGVVSLPYMVVLDADGKLVTDSHRPSQGKSTDKNIGFPDQPEDIAWFVEMMKKGAPQLSDQEAEQISSVLKQPQS